MEPRLAATKHFAIELLPARGYETEFRAPFLTIGCALSDQTGVHALASSQRKPYQRFANSFAITPAQCDIYSWSERGGEYLTISVLDHDLTPAQQSLVTNRVNILAGHIAHQARRLLLSTQNTSPLEIDRLGYASLGLLEGNIAEQQLIALTDARRRILRDYIEAHLADPITVQQLAATVGLSPRYFSGIFREGMGTTPHGFIIERRLTRVRELLKTSISKTNWPLAQIALETGFHSQAHMTQTFRQRLGITPSQYRALHNS